MFWYIFFNLLTIVILHYIFLVSFGTIQIFKFQNYYSNSHSLKEIIMITKTYHIITINIIENNWYYSQPKLFFSLSYVGTLNWTEVIWNRPNGPNRLYWLIWTEWTKLDWIGRNGPNWPEKDWLDQSRVNEQKYTEVDQIGLNWPKLIEWT